MNLEHIKLPPIYRRNGKDCYLDQIRKRLTYVLPEETVRQKVLAYLVEVKKIPVEQLAVEESLRHYGLNSTKRADIIITRPNNTESKPSALAVIECKAPEIMIGTRELKQLTGYADALNCDYAFLTNGENSFFYVYNNDKNLYEEIEEIPFYTDMLAGFHQELVRPEPEPRPAFENLTSTMKQIRKENKYCGIAENTPLSKAVIALNLLHCFWDTNYTLPEIKTSHFTLLKDLGIRWLSFGNHVGRSYFTIYRSFLIQVGDNAEIVSLGFNDYGPDRTILCVGIDNEKASHHALQLGIDDNVLVIKNVCKFEHSGKIAVGHMGSGKVSELRVCVNKFAPHLVQEKNFYLGNLTNDRNWTLSDKEIVELTTNLITYALARDIFREELKKRRQKE